MRSLHVEAEPCFGRPQAQRGGRPSVLAATSIVMCLLLCLLLSSALLLSLVLPSFRIYPAANSPQGDDFQRLYFAANFLYVHEPLHRNRQPAPFIPKKNQLECFGCRVGAIWCFINWLLRGADSSLCHFYPFYQLYHTFLLSLTLRAAGCSLQATRTDCRFNSTATAESVPKEQPGPWDGPGHGP